MLNVLLDFLWCFASQQEQEVIASIAELFLGVLVQMELSRIAWMASSI
jgi:hypothetical protein